MKYFLTNLKAWAAIVALFAATLCAQAQTTIPGTDLQWDFTEGTGTLTINGEGAMPDYGTNNMPWSSLRTSITRVVIEDGVSGIGNYAFYDCSALTSAVISESVETIGNYAFQSCIGLEIISIPAVKTIADNAFWGCSALSSLTIPESVTSVGSHAFYNCSNLETVNFNAINCATMGSYYYPVFNGCSKLSEVITGNEVENIPDYAFYNCNALTTVRISGSVTSVGTEAFRGCSALTDLYVLWTDLSSVTINTTNLFYGATLSGVTLHVPAGVSDTYRQHTFWSQFAIPMQQYELPCSTPTAQGLAGSAVWALCNGTLTISGAVIPDYSTASRPPWYDYRNSITGVVFKGVTRIGHFAFDGCTNPAFASVTIPESVTWIGNSAFGSCSGITSVNFNATDCATMGSSGANSVFYGCSNLTSLNIGNEVKIIPANAFEGCRGLTMVAIPESVITIGNYAFYGCSSLQSVNFDAMNCTYMGSNGYPVFDGCSILTEIHIGNKVETIPAYAFCNIRGLLSVNIPESVTSVGNSAFQGCSGLETFIIPDEITSISDNLFSGCTGLTSVTIPESILSIGGGAFTNCSKLAEISIPSLVKTIGNSAFQGCILLTSVDIPESVTSMGYMSFRDCIGVRDVYVHWTDLSSVTVDSYSFYGLTLSGINLHVPSEGADEYRKHTFWGQFNIPFDLSELPCSDPFEYGSSGTLLWAICDGTLIISGEGDMLNYSSGTAPWYPYRDHFTALVVEDGITHIGNYAFNGCDGLTSVVIQESVKTIGDQAFRNCTGLELIDIPASVTSIGNSAFEGCTGLISLIISESVITIGNYAFYGCNSLQSVNFDAMNCTYMGSNGYPVFDGCTKLSEIQIGNKVKTIPAYAFCNIRGLLSVDIPESVTSVGNSAFQGCSGLETFIIPDEITSISDNLFSGCTGLTSVTIPESILSIGGGAFYNCNQLTEISIPSLVKTIGSSAFQGCVLLTSVDIPESVNSIGYMSFRDCIGIRDVYVNWTDLSSVTVDSYSFYGLTLSGVTLHVPADVAEVYQTHSFWNQFNIWLDSYELPCDDPFEYGSSGTLLWAICDGTLIVSGEGDMLNYGTGTAPWYPYRDHFTGVVLKNGITHIGNYAFYGCDGLTSVVIQESVKTVGDQAFRNCAGLELIDIPASVTSIGNSAFEGCTGLMSLMISESVITIGNYAFYGCSSLQSVNFDAMNCTYMGSNGYPVFDGCTKLSEIQIGKKVKTIPAYAFCNIRGLLSVNIPESVTSIGNSAFQGCSGLETFIIPDEISSISDNLFSGCTGLTSVTIPESILSIGSGAFYNCNQLTEISIPSLVKTIGNSAFQGCILLTSVDIPETVTSMGYMSFRDCIGIRDVYVNWTDLSSVTVDSYSFYGLTLSGVNLHVPADVITAYQNHTFWNQFNILSDSYELPCDEPFEYGSSGTLLWAICDGTLIVSGEGDMLNYGTGTAPWYPYRDHFTGVVLKNGITHIGNYAFYGCDGLTSVVIQESVKTVGDQAFRNCAGLELIDIPASVTSIGNSAFEGCTGLLSLMISESVITIGNYAFYGCNSLLSVNFDAMNCTYMGSNGYPVFEGCTKLSEIQIGNKVKTIPAYAFCNIRGLLSVNIPKSVTSLGNSAFQGCSGLTSIVIPDAVTSISDNVFSGCTGLTSVIIPEAVTYIGGGAFYNCNKLISVSIPYLVRTIGNSAFQGCVLLTSVAIPESVNSIGYMAFRDCNSLTSVTCLVSVPPILDGYAFYGVNITNCTLYVPFGTKGLYENATEWKNFGSIEEEVTQQADFEALVAFYNTLGGAQWTSTLKNYYKPWEINNPQSPVSTWYGVSINARQVSALWLPNNEMTGTLPDLDAFAALTALNISGNHIRELTAALPARIATLYLGGQILEMGELKLPPAANVNAEVPNICLYSHSAQNFPATPSFMVYVDGVEVGTVTVSGGQVTIPQTMLAQADGNSSVVLLQTDGDAKDTQLRWRGDNTAPKRLTIMGITANDKVYDGNATAQFVRSGRLSGVAYGHEVTIDYGEATATFDNARAGTDKTVTISGVALSGAHAGLYTLEQPTGVTAGITPKPLTISGLKVKDKIYDGAIAAELDGTGTLNGILEGDAVSFDATGAVAIFNDARAGDNKPATVSEIALTGADAGNYSLKPQPATGNIAKAELILKEMTIRDKEYDGTPAAYVGQAGVFEGLVPAGNRVTGVVTATYDTPEVGEAKPVNVMDVTLSGTDAPNYTLKEWTAAHTASITPRNVTIYGMEVEEKLYDGTIDAVIETTGTLSWKATGDDVTIDVTQAVARFYDAGAGYSKPVSVSGVTLAGASAGNYSLGQFAVTGNIVRQGVNIVTLPTATPIIEGQMLRRSELTGGEMSVSGKFRFEQPDFKPSVGTHEQPVWFTPISDNYETVPLTVPVTVTPRSYAISASTGKEIYTTGETVTINGTLNLTGFGEPVSVSNIAVEINIDVIGYRRTLQATTNASGEFTAVFVPQNDEAGHYTIVCNVEDEPDDEIAHEFDIVAMRLATGGYITWQIEQNKNQTGTVRIQNRTGKELTNITIGVVTGTSNAGVVFDAEPVLWGNSYVDVRYTVTALTPTDGSDWEEIELKAVCSEGAEVSFKAFFYCFEPRSVLQALPGDISTTMTTGKSKLVDIRLTNNGAGATGEMTVLLPNVPWMSLLTERIIPSVAPGETMQFTLNLNPGTQLQLGPYSGNIVVKNENGNSVNIPFNIRAVSEFTGQLTVDVTDEFSYNTETKPHLSNAKITLTDPFTNAVVAQGLTGEDGLFVTGQLPEGQYTLHVSADKHDNYRATVFIEAGTSREMEIFISFNAITYTFIVTPTEIEDEYTIELVIKYETYVPKPVLVIDMPKTMPILDDNETYTFLIKVTNKGLITASDVILELPEDPIYQFTYSVGQIDLAADQSVEIPVTMSHKSGMVRSAATDNCPPCKGDFGASGSYPCGAIWYHTDGRVGAYYEGRPCTDCNSNDGSNGWWGGSNGWWGGNGNGVDDMSNKSGKPGAPCPTCGNNPPSDPGWNWPPTPGYIFSPKSCSKSSGSIGLKSLGTSNVTVTHIFLNTYHEKIKEWYPDSYAIIYEMMNNKIKRLDEDDPYDENDVCASIVLQIDQKLVMTREAFRGTLTIYNGHPTDAMEEVNLELTVHDMDGNDCSDFFQIVSPENTQSLRNLTGIDGTGKLAAKTEGSVTVLYIPTKNAATEEATMYRFGGNLSYFDPFVSETATVNLMPVRLEVHPSPDLYIEYFVQRDVYGDDPLTPDVVEPVIPAELAVLIDNRGFGDANKVTIQSAQPVITENEKGLLIDFKLISSNLNGQPQQMGFTNISFGTIPAHAQALGQWWLTSSLMGHFYSFEARITHLNSYGNPDLSLISEVNIHELHRSIRGHSDPHKGVIGFLVNDDPDARSTPDAIWFANGTQTAVQQAVNAATDGILNASNKMLTLTVEVASSGWAYACTDDPGKGKYRLKSVTREDGQAIPLNNVWQTHVTMLDHRVPKYENRIHLADTFAMASLVRYTLEFEDAPEANLHILAINGAPAEPTAQPVEKLEVVFNQPVKAGTFNWTSLDLFTLGSNNLITSEVTVTPKDDRTYEIDLSAVTQRSGQYTLTIHQEGILDMDGQACQKPAQVTWVQVFSQNITTEQHTICEGDVYYFHDQTLGQAGDYYHVEYVDEAENITKLVLTVLPAPAISLGDNRTVTGLTAELDAGEGFASYLWSTGASDRKITVTGADGETKTVSVTVTNAAGCNATAEVSITFRVAAGNTFTVTFNSQGGSAIAEQQVQEGGKVIRPADPVRSGFTFDGWYKEATCVNVWNFDTDAVTGALTLYAKWNPVTGNTFTVTFNSQGGSAIAEQQVQEGGKVIRPADPARSGFTFDGWYKEATCLNIWNFDTDAVTANLTLYAKWNPVTGNTFTVTFNSQGGSAIAGQQVDEGGKVIRPADPARSGFTFDGWYKEATCLNIWNFDTDAVTGTLTLYAKWNSITGISEIERLKAQIYPNPVQSGKPFYIQLEAKTAVATLVEIFNEAGSLMFRTSGSDEPILMTAPDAAGSYFIRITNGKQTQTYKLVVE